MKAVFVLLISLASIFLLIHFSQNDSSQQPSRVVEKESIKPALNMPTPTPNLGIEEIEIENKSHQTKIYLDNDFPESLPSHKSQGQYIGHFLNADRDQWNNFDNATPQHIGPLLSAEPDDYKAIYEQLNQNSAPQHIGEYLPPIPDEDWNSNETIHIGEWIPLESPR